MFEAQNFANNHQKSIGGYIFANAPSFFVAIFIIQLTCGRTKLVMIIFLCLLPHPQNSQKFVPQKILAIQLLLRLSVNKYEYKTLVFTLKSKVK